MPAGRAGPAKRQQRFDQCPQVVVHDPRPGTHSITNGRIVRSVTAYQATSTSLTVTASGVTVGYTYDPFGRQESVTSQGEVVSRSAYDGVDHVVESQKRGDTGAMKSTTYTFDPLDRTASKTADSTSDLTYLGLSGEVLKEEVAGELTKSY